jgi:hypothetical protein
MIVTDRQIEDNEVSIINEPVTPENVTSIRAAFVACRAVRGAR